MFRLDLIQYDYKGVKVIEHGYKYASCKDVRVGEKEIFAALLVARAQLLVM